MGQIRYTTDNINQKLDDKIVTTNFSRSSGANPNTVDASKNVAVAITINGVTTNATITKNNAGEILTMVAPDQNTNASMAFSRASNVVDATKTKTQTRVLNVGGANVSQTRTITRNASNEILSISEWA